MLQRAKRASHDVVSQVEAAVRRRAAPLVLELDLTEPLVEATPRDPLGALIARRRTSVRAVVEGLRRAGDDARVVALVAKLGGPGSRLSLALAQEVRDAVHDFRTHGKAAVAWAETFGELARGTVPYYVATGFDEIWLQPSGDVCVTGVATQVPFLRDALDKARITPQVARRHEYKNAADPFTEQAFTTAHREATEHLVASVMHQLVDGIARERGLDAAEVRALVDRAPLPATEALQAGLVDRLGYRDEVYAAVRARAGADAALLYVARYARAGASLPARLGMAPRPRIALVEVTGPIHLGRSGRRALTGPTSGSDTVTAALRSAARDPGVKAVVLRVASPGGSYVASDAIWRQVALTREAGTPVVVSMGHVAASGGYYVSMGADAIVAEPGTVTGSIGVLAGKPVVDRLLDRLGIRLENVSDGAHAQMLSPSRAFSEEEWALLDAWLDRIYDDFTAKVASGRGLPLDHVRAVARGRVWTGADARDHGLVDVLGGLGTAVDLARERAGLPPSTRPELRLHPRLPLASRVRSPRSSEDPAAAAGTAVPPGAWGPFTDLAARLGLPAYGPLTLPGDWTLA
jgi:protease-4